MNVTLHLHVEKVSLENLSSGEDTLYVEGTLVETSYRSFNYTPSSYRYDITITIIRRVHPADLRKQKLSMMPGFRITWHYSGMEVESEDTFKSHRITTAFIRNCSNNFVSIINIIIPLYNI